MFKRTVCCLLLLCYAGVVSASARNGREKNAPDSDGEGALSNWFKSDRTAAPVPEEKPFQMPELGQLKDWRVYPVEKVMGSSRIEIATDSVQVGAEDGIIRYAIAITPKRGPRNVLFEGLDCNTSRYRSYAFGQPDQTWRKIDTVTWRVGQLNTINAWQGQLLKDFCGFTGTSAKSIVKLLQGEAPAPQKDGGKQQ